jgi:WD40 repeat protein
MKISLYIFTILLLFLTGCTAHPVEVALTSTPFATSFPTSTFTPISPSATPTITVTPTTTPDAYLTVDCLDVLPVLPEIVQLQGTLALGTFFGKTNQAYLFNLETGSKIPLLGRDDEILRAFSVSPDSRWLAYTSSRTKENWTDRLVIMGVDGQPVKDRLISTREWVYMDGWLDNQNLIFEKYDPVNWSRYGGPLSTIIYNAFTSQQEEIKPGYPGMLNSGLRIWGWPYTQTVYDPTLSLVAYPLNDWAIILWDRENNKEIARFPKTSDTVFDTIPVWSPDGRLMLIINPPASESIGEIYSVSADGIVTRLTYFANSPSNILPKFLRWSPDMKSVAFWLVENEVPRLVVLDLKTKFVTNYCLEGMESHKNMSGLLAAPIWSPDSKNLLINIPDGIDKALVVVVNIEQNYAAQLTEGMLVMGWLSNEQK